MVSICTSCGGAFAAPLDICHACAALLSTTAARAGSRRWPPGGKAARPALRARDAVALERLLHACRQAGDAISQALSLKLEDACILPPDAALEEIASLGSRVVFSANGDAAQARVLVLDAAKRVSVVTAVSPRAMVDLAYVMFEIGRLIRRISELYGGRPGTLGFFRLARSVVAHLAVTGAVAAGDDFVHQIVGQDLAARLSARLGEGVVNGMMTARIGIAAMQAARPLPFDAVRRPGLSDFLSALTSFTKRKAAGAEPS